jgi:hypothetical protein
MPELTIFKDRSSSMISRLRMSIVKRTSMKFFPTLRISCRIGTIPNTLKS